MISIIVTIIVSVLFGTISPAIFSGVNFLPQQNLFSQIISGNQKKDLPAESSQSNLSKIDPMSSLGSITLPLDHIWKTLGQRLDIPDLGTVRNYLSSEIQKEASDSTLSPQANLPQEALLNAENTSASSVQSKLDSVSVWNALGIAKQGFILIAQILVTVFEIAAWGLRAVLNIVT